MPQPFNENPGSIDFEPTPNDSGSESLGAIVEKTLDDLRFPLSKSELLSRAGQRRLRFPNGQTVALFDLLVGVKQSEFESASALADVLSHPQWSHSP